MSARRDGLRNRADWPDPPLTTAQHRRLVAVIAAGRAIRTLSGMRDRDTLPVHRRAVRIETAPATPIRLHRDVARR
jgi:hypothetical protein